MEPTQELVDALYLEKVQAAMRMSEGERFVAGLRLFDFACEWTKAGIRMDCPDASEEEVLELLRERLTIAERLEATE